MSAEERTRTRGTESTGGAELNWPAQWLFDRLLGLLVELSAACNAHGHYPCLRQYEAACDFPECTMTRHKTFGWRQMTQIAQIVLAEAVVLALGSGALLIIALVFDADTRSLVTFSTR